MATATTADKETVDSIPWFHSIDLGGGIVTPGNVPNVVMERPGAFPDVRGKTVLDIGAWDGMYSFRAEQSGARRVVALDHYVWQADFAARAEYWAQCERDGIVPDPELVERGFLLNDSLPGRRGFDYAHQVLGSSVEPLVADFSTCDLGEVGIFDVVLYLGVLYHMREPLRALERVRKVTGHLAVIETEAVRVMGHGRASLLALYGRNELNGDYGNWYAPSERALHDMCSAVGFSRVETKVGPPPPWKNFRERWHQVRTVRTLERYRLVVHAFV